jgi:hypothetical protein
MLTFHDLRNELITPLTFKVDFIFDPLEHDFTEKFVFGYQSLICQENWLWFDRIGVKL